MVEVTKQGGWPNDKDLFWPDNTDQPSPEKIDAAIADVRYVQHEPAYGNAADSFDIDDLSAGLNIMTPLKVVAPGKTKVGGGKLYRKAMTQRILELGKGLHGCAVGTDEDDFSRAEIAARTMALYLEYTMLVSICIYPDDSLHTLGLRSQREIGGKTKFDEYLRQEIAANPEAVSMAEEILADAGWAVNINVVPGQLRDNFDENSPIFQASYGFPEGETCQAKIITTRGVIDNTPVRKLTIKARTVVHAAQERQLQYQ